MIALPTSFLPSVHYLALLLQHEKEVVIYTGERFRKQSLRSRTSLLSANGAISFSLPLQSFGFPPPSSHCIKISEHGHWHHRLMETLKSCYSSAPFWLYFQDEIEQLACHPTTSLLTEYNHQWLSLLCQAWGVKPPPLISTLPHNAILNENILHPNHLKSQPTPRYWQVFEHSLGHFTPYLSAIDLLLNLGPEGRLYLHSISSLL